MDIDFTTSLWLNLILFGFFVGLGWQLAFAIYTFMLWVLSQRKPQA